MTHKQHPVSGFGSRSLPTPPRTGQAPRLEGIDRTRAAETLTRLRAFRIRGGLSDNDWRRELKKFGFDLRSNGKASSHNLDICFGDTPVRDPATGKVMTVENRNARGAGLGIAYVNVTVKALIRYMEGISQQ